jgi:hypothetical protein
MILDIKWFSYIFDHIHYTILELNVLCYVQLGVMKLHRIATNYISEWEYVKQNKGECCERQ